MPLMQLRHGNIFSVDNFVHVEDQDEGIFLFADVGNVFIGESAVVFAGEGFVGGVDYIVDGVDDDADDGFA